MSMNNTNPSILFGGTWTQLKDRFLLGVGDTYKTVNSTGGSINHTPNGTVNGHTLTIDEMPKHNHSIQVWNPYSNGAMSGYKIGRTIDEADGGSDNSTSLYNTGGSKPHNHTFTGTSQNTMPPYLTVYMWKRTA